MHAKLDLTLPQRIDKSRIFEITNHNRNELQIPNSSSDFYSS